MSPCGLQAIAYSSPVPVARVRRERLQWGQGLLWESMSAKARSPGTGLEKAQRTVPGRKTELNNETYSQDTKQISVFMTTCHRNMTTETILHAGLRLCIIHSRKMKRWNWNPCVELHTTLSAGTGSSCTNLKGHFEEVFGDLHHSRVSQLSWHTDPGVWGDDCVAQFLDGDDHRPVRNHWRKMLKLVKNYNKILLIKKTCIKNSVGLHI